MRSLAAGLWLALAVVVWNVTFDWQTREEARAFAAQQVLRARDGGPRATLNEGFRPRVGAVARQSSAWAGAILAVGAAGMLAARRPPGRHA